MSFDNLTLDMRVRAVFFQSLASGGRGSLGAARLACRGLRDLVDGGVTELDLKLGQNDMNTLDQSFPRHGCGPFPSPLLRWQTVQRLSVKLVGTGGPVWLVETLRWLFTGIPADTLARITVHSRHRPRLSDLVAALPPQLPGLKTLDISECCSPVRPSTDPHVFTSLAFRFPALEDLALPAGSHLAGVGALGGLQRLRIGPVNPTWMGGWRLFESVLVGMPGLQQLLKLRELIFSGCSIGSGLQLGSVLTAVPPGVETLELKGVHLTRSPFSRLDAVRMQLEGGRLATVEVEAGSGGGPELNVLAEGLLRWAALGPQLPRLRFSNLNADCLYDIERFHNYMLRELLRRCVQTELDHLRAEAPTSSAADTRVFMQLFGPPRLLSLRFDDSWDYILLDLQQNQPAAAAPGPTLDTAGPQQVWEEAVWRVREAVRRDREAALVSAGAGPGAARAGPVTPADGGSIVSAMLLYGPAGGLPTEVARNYVWSLRGSNGGGGGGGDGGGCCVLLQYADPPRDWRAWLHRLRTQAQERPQRPTATSGPSQGARLPRSSAVLVGCSSPEAAAALVASAASATTTTTTTGDAGEAGPGVEAFRVPYNTPDEAVLGLLKPVLQDLWSSSVGDGASVADRVQRMMGLMRGIAEQLRDIDPMVDD